MHFARPTVVQARKPRKGLITVSAMGETYAVPRLTALIALPSLWRRIFVRYLPPLLLLLSWELFLVGFTLFAWSSRQPLAIKVVVSVVGSAAAVMSSLSALQLFVL